MSPYAIKLMELAQKYFKPNKTELAHFLGQCHYETQEFTKLAENFNYTPERMLEIFKDKITPNFAHNNGKTSTKPANQEAIANLVYGGKFGNRPNTNDGWNYRGRGCIHLTFLDNYKRCNAWLNQQGHKVDIVKNPDLVATDITIGALTAVWYWLDKKISAKAIADDYQGVTKLINAGAVDWQKRINQVNIYKMVL